VDPKIQILKAEKIINHPSFTSLENGSDIALVYLDREVNWSGVVKPICLAADEDLSFAGVVGTVAGWGAIELDEEDESKATSNILKNVDVPIIHNKQCKQWLEEELGETVSLIDSLMCAGLKQGGRDACQGDSGGSLMVKHWSGRYVSAGIVSWGYSCGKPKLPGVYTRVASHINWIIATIAKQKFIENNQMFFRNDI
jgi:secreted trypsin-like serine protease